MNRATRNKLASGTDQMALTSGNACWETAPAVFAQLNADFGPFDIDICADPGRALCPVFFGPGSPWLPDALAGGWGEHGTNGFDNPPYGAFVQKMLDVAIGECLCGVTSTHLLPMRVTKAFKSLILPCAAELLFCDKRLTFFENGAPRCSFDRAGKLRPDTALFDSIVVRFVPGRMGHLKVGTWAVPKHVSPEDIERARERRLLKEAA